MQRQGVRIPEERAPPRNDGSPEERPLPPHRAGPSRQSSPRHRATRAPNKPARPAEKRGAPGDAGLAAQPAAPHRRMRREPGRTQRDPRPQVSARRAIRRSQPMRRRRATSPRPPTDRPRVRTALRRTTPLPRALLTSGTASRRWRARRWTAIRRLTPLPVRRRTGRPNLGVSTGVRAWPCGRCGGCSPERDASRTWRRGMSPPRRISSCWALPSTSEPRRIPNAIAAADPSVTRTIAPSSRRFAISAARRSRFVSFICRVSSSSRRDRPHCRVSIRSSWSRGPSVLETLLSSSLQIARRSVRGNAAVGISDAGRRGAARSL